MFTKTRVPNKVLWNMAKIQAACRAADPELQQVLSWAERHMDPLLMRSVARLQASLSEIERRALDARYGEYSDR